MKRQPPPPPNSDSDPPPADIITDKTTMRINLTDPSSSSSSFFPADDLLPPGRVPFGRPMRALFNFAPSYHPLNHGSYGTFPRYVLEAKIQKLREFESRPSVYRTFVYPRQLRHARGLVAPLLGADVDEVVLVPNATTGINTVLRNILPTYGPDDVVICPSTIYPSCWNTLRSVAEEMDGRTDIPGNSSTGNSRSNSFSLAQIPVEYPISDDDLVEAFREAIVAVNEQTSNSKQGGKKRVRLAIFDTIVSGPGVRVPWERLVAECRALGVMSLVDGAHGIGHIDLTETGTSVRPDFLVTNCHKWLFVPRGCAVLYVPFENQGLIKTALPTSHGYLAPELRQPPCPLSHYYHADDDDDDENENEMIKQNIFEGPFQGRGGERGPWSDYFTNLFVDVATVDSSSYTCIAAALEFRDKVCGGEEAIRDYCFRLAFQGGNRVAEMLGTNVMDVADITGCGNLRRCNFANVRLPLQVQTTGTDLDTSRNGNSSSVIREEDVRDVTVWIYRTAARDYDTYLQTFYHGGCFWTRFSAQIYLEMADFEWGARTLLEICERVKRGEWRGTTSTTTTATTTFT